MISDRIIELQFKRLDCGLTKDEKEEFNHLVELHNDGFIR